MSTAIQAEVTTQAPVHPAAAPSVTAVPADPVLGEVRRKLSEVAQPDNEQDQKDIDALRAYYSSPEGKALWVSDRGSTQAAKNLVRALADADAYGLDSKAFKVPPLEDGSLAGRETGDLANVEITVSRAALLYARYARGGRIPQPAEMLNSNLDRRPQWIDPKIVMAALAKTDAPDSYLRGLNPHHPQFEKLRELYVAELAKSKNGKLNAQAKRLRANMEMWRWMWEDMGHLYVLNNIPEFMQYVYRDGEIIRKEKIVAGLIDKQSSIFSRPLKYVVLRPKWIVPESIKVKELWPSLRRGGGLMRQYGLQLETKDGKTINWRTIDWNKADIRDYDVTQPPGPKSVLGHVKFSFPSQHTIFMHDTPDKWMFRASQRTLSHGCLRVQKPMELAEIVLKEDKGWDAEKVAEVSRSGPLNNEILIDKEIPIHLVYFTEWVSEDGKLKSFRDVYGHEKRITQALDGDWDKINKGRDHLAPPQPEFGGRNISAADSDDEQTPIGVRPPGGRRSVQKNATIGDIIGDALGLGF